jgi:hypothetical protein
MRYGTKLFGQAMPFHLKLRLATLCDAYSANLICLVQKRQSPPKPIRSNLSCFVIWTAPTGREIFLAASTSCYKMALIRTKIKVILYIGLLALDYQKTSAKPCKIFSASAKRNGYNNKTRHPIPYKSHIRPIYILTTCLL